MSQVIPHPLHAATGAWLLKVSDQWATVADDLTNAFEESLDRLIAAGLLEARFDVCLDMPARQEKVTGRVRVSGDYKVALHSQLLTFGGPGWLDESGRTTAATQFSQVGEWQVRLTGEGGYAKSLWQAGNIRPVLASLWGDSTHEPFIARAKIEIGDARFLPANLASITTNVNNTRVAIESFPTPEGSQRTAAIRYQFCEGFSPPAVVNRGGDSPLSRYVDFLVTVYHNIPKLLKRDAEAVRILMADPALPEAIQRADKWYWNRQIELRTGKTRGIRRIWTRRDERRVNQQRGLAAPGFRETGRLGRYLTRLTPRQGLSIHDRHFRNTVDEARRDGTATVLCPKLEAAKATFDRMFAAARSMANGDGGRPEFEAAHDELGSHAIELMTWTPPPAEPIETTRPEEAPVQATPDKGNIVTWQDAKAKLDEFRVNGERYTSRGDLARRIGCSVSTVQKAIDNGSIELQEWASRQRGASRLNVTPEVATVAIESNAQSREPDPANMLHDCDVDVVLAKLLDQVSPDERARIHGMTPAEKRQLAEAVYRDPDKDEQALRHRRANRAPRG